LKRALTILIFFCVLLDIYSQSIDSAFKYFDSGQYERAAVEFQKVLPLAEKEFGIADTTYYTYFLVYTAISFERTNQYDKAEEYYLKAASVYEKANELSNPAYLKVISSLAGLYYTTGEFEKAENLYLKALEKSETLFGKQSRNHMNALNNIARLYQKIGYTDKAETFYLDALNVSRNIFGDKHPENALLINNLATLYHKQGNYRKAELMYLEALEISISNYGNENSATVSLLNNTGALYDDMGNFSKAEALYLRALETRKKGSGEESPDYALSANNLAHLYFKMGFYDKAESLYLRALEITRKIYGEQHYSYASALNNLGGLYHNMGNYDRAEMFYLQALHIRKMVYGEKHPEYANSLSNLALFYQDIGNFRKAGSFYQEALEIRRATTGEEHPDYAVILNNMALFCSETGKYEQAEILLKQALDIRKRIFGEIHPYYAVSLNNLALLYHDMHRYDEAEELFLKALKISTELSGGMTADHASMLNNLGELYDTQGNHEKSEKLYVQSLEILKKVYGEKHPDYASVLNNLALLYQETGKPEKAEPVYQSSMKIYLSQIKQQFSFLSEKEKEIYLNKVLFFFRTYQNFILKQQIQDPALAGRAYDIEIISKGLLLNSDRQLRMSVLTSHDTAAIRIFDTWTALKASMAKQFSLPVGQQSSNLNKMEEQAEELERKLARITSVKNPVSPIPALHWQDIRKILKEGDIAIEFTDVPYYNGQQWTDSTLYIALLLRKNDLYPEIVPLFEGSQLDSLMQRKSPSEITFINDLYRWEKRDSPVLQGKGRQLYNLLWQPLEKHLAGIRNIYYSPSGRLHQVSFAAIPCSKTEYLSDRFSLYQLSSTLQLTLSHPPNPVKEICLYGGINYDTDYNTMRNTAVHYNKNTAGTSPLQVSTLAEKETASADSWIYLDGTRSEVEKIRKIALDKGILSSLLSGNEAVEESVKSLSGNSSPGILHIATHGFFFPDPAKDPKKNIFRTPDEITVKPFRSSDNPLMRCGLVFTGGNHVWAGCDVPPDLDDGILTAYEVSGMFIPNTELVVLSACETGLGEIKGSEGVFGLQRSFRIAGTGYVLMTLWQIPDYQTSELMNHFYQEWFSGRSIYEALRLAQDLMKDKYPLQPYMWAGFVLVR